MRERLANFLEALGAAVFSLVLFCRWVHATLIAPIGGWLVDVVLPVYEETVKAFVREWFSVISRNLNTASAFLLSLLSGRSYRRTAAQHAAQKQQAWHRWWRSARGTFNVLLEQEGLAGTSSNGSTHSSGGSSNPGDTTPIAPRLPSLRLARPSPILQQRRSGPASSSGSEGGWWRFWRRGSSRSSRGGGDETPSTPVGSSDLRRGSVLFELPSGFAVAQMVSSRGLLEDLRVGSEVAVGRAFGAVRRGLNRALLLDAAGRGTDREGSPADLLARGMRRAAQQQQQQQQQHGGSQQQTAGPPAASHSADGVQGSSSSGAQPAASVAGRPARRSGRPPLKSLLRSGRHWEEDLSVWTASDVILREGYPLEQHSVTTSDGYVLQMHRIPRHGARDVVFFQHGVLDTSLGWVSNGVVGSAAFAAYDAGFDVWLGNSRSNAPRLHIDAEKQDSRYWHYSINEMGIYDISAAVTHIHNTKMAELAAPGRHTAAAQEPPLQVSPTLRRAATDSALEAVRWVDVHSGLSTSDVEQGMSRSAALPTEGCILERPPAGPASQPVGDLGAGQQPGSRENRQQQQEQGQYWWERLGANPPNGQQHSDAAQSLAGRGASPLRRTQSAQDPMQQGRGSAGPGHVAVPINTRSMRQQRQAEASSGIRGSGDPAAGQAAAAAAPAGAACVGAAHDVLPYRLQAVGHSLGAATLLMYAVVCRMQGRPHRLRRLVLMSPAGIHPRVPRGLAWCVPTFPAAVWLLDRTPLLRGRGLGLRLPSPLLRFITFKLTMDLRNMPALNDLVKAFMKMMLSGDSSEWDAALQMPHYSTYSMPALSLHSGAHFAQWAKDPSFRLFDYGTSAANRRHYGADKPPSLADHYHLLDLPVDLLAGAADGIIPPASVVQHVHRLRAAGVPCSFRILPAGHMDLTFAVRDDIRLWVLGKLRSPL